MKWNREICTMDSDHDGLTNGEELGDPECVWSTGETPSRTKNISHPGICEPLNAAHCQKTNTWLQCDQEDKDCQALNKDDVMSKKLRFPKSDIPEATTSYYCMIFDLPADDTYHLIGTKPIIDNKDITHHILLFGCDDRVRQIDSPREPYQCSMVAHRQCLSIIGTWTVGSHGDCLHNSTGFKIGASGFKRAAMQIHWNNQFKTSNLTDSSGLEIFYTRNLRHNDAGMFTTGQEYLKIPPGIAEISFQSTCSSDCTKVMFPNSVYITRAVNHMHYKGIRQTIEIYRDNQKVRGVTNDIHYNYDRPVFYKFDPPIKVKPGDYIRTTCTYTSLISNKTTFFGEGTSDEMCYGFITYYPMQDIALPYCTTWKSVEKCKRYLPQFDGIVNGCKWREFLSGSGLLVIELAIHCDSTCSFNCTEKVRELRKHECLQGDLGDFMVHKLRSKYPSEVISAIQDCYRTNHSVPIVASLAVLICSFMLTIIFKESFK